MSSKPPATPASPSGPNPLLELWTDPRGLPPFAAIRAEHFAPAFAVALREHRDELDAIAAQADAPTFANTLLAFDRSGALLTRIEAVFHNLASSETSPALQAAERDLAAPLAAHNNAIYTHAGLFRRIEALHRERAGLGLDAEQLRLLERLHLDFVRAGARLAPEAQVRYGQIMEKLAQLTTQFSQNVLAAESDYQLVLREEDDLAGLPPFVRAAAKQAAAERGVADAWVITLSRSLITPFLTFSSRRDLREQAYRAWLRRGEHSPDDAGSRARPPGSIDNRPLIGAIMRLRSEQARLLGYATYADYALADTMAGNQKAVTDLFMKVWPRAKARAAGELAALQAAADAESGQRIPIEPWDWFYYAEKVRQTQYALEDAALKPYFSLDRMVEAVFDCANRLFGIRFIALPEAKAYHPDVKVYEVRDAPTTGDAQGRLVGLFLHDNFARSSKRGGAWMSSYRIHRRAAAPGESDVTPVIVNNNNFAKGAPGAPTLLSFDDARTLFHEFGHGLHGLLSDAHYERLAGTAVLRDFVELPSQLFEHWLAEPAVLKRHALHYRTGEAIPDELIARLKAAEHFNQGFETVAFIASGLVDMALHSRSDFDGLDVDTFEREELARLGMPKQIQMRHRLPHFGHLFSGSSYAAGYYVYLWAEVLDADGYEAFVEAGDPFDRVVAERLRRYIYSRGNTLPPMEAYRAFRGKAPVVEPMLKGRGLLDEVAAAAD